MVTVEVSSCKGRRRKQKMSLIPSCCMLSSRRHELPSNPAYVVWQMVSSAFHISLWHYILRYRHLIMIFPSPSMNHHSVTMPLWGKTQQTQWAKNIVWSMEIYVPSLLGKADHTYCAQIYRWVMEIYICMSGLLSMLRCISPVTIPKYWYRDIINKNIATSSRGNIVPSFPCLILDLSSSLIIFRLHLNQFYICVSCAF